VRVVFVPDFVHGFKAPWSLVKTVGKVDYQGRDGPDVFISMYDPRRDDDLQPLAAFQRDRFVKAKRWRIAAVVPQVDLVRAISGP
jgi:hypothetical protein